MAYLQKKKIRGRVYYYYTQTKRIDGRSKKVRQVYLGTPDQIFEKCAGVGAADSPVKASHLECNCRTAMGRKNKETIAEETLEIRLKLWKLIQKGKSEEEALDAVLPIFRDRVRRRKNGDRSVRLKTWKEMGLFPPPEADGRVLRMEGKSKRKNGLKIIDGGLSEKQILRGALKVLEKMEIPEKEWTGGRNKRLATVRRKILGGRMPVSLINEINRLRGSKTYHLEKALRFYLKVLKAKDL